MARMFYWYARHKEDGVSVVGRTKREVRAEMKALGEELFEEPVQKVIEYQTAYDLFKEVTAPGNGRGMGSNTRET